ncbi:MAG TPA: hypothetical protein VGM30_22805 [Puia sp.]|jgi:hypothetical protein
MRSISRSGALSRYGFRRVYDSINRHGIKKGVDEMGIDGFIEHCARLAAGTGAITGMGGAVTMIVGIPADLLNNVTQQFRVTLAVIYDQRGDYHMGFEEFMSVVAVSIGVETGAVMTRTLLTRVAEKLLIRMGEKAAGRMIPFAGALVGGVTNYLFIKGIGKTLKRLHF